MRRYLLAVREVCLPALAAAAPRHAPAFLS
jgi:hypothetical protein